MTDGADGAAEVVNVDAAVVAEEERGSSEHRILGMLVYGVVAVLLYFVLRMLVLAAFALPFALLPKTQMFAALWMLFGQPIALAIGAYVTLLTNRRNRPMHLALSVVVFGSVVIGHIEIGVLNPYIAHAVDDLRVTAWVMQAIFVAIGAAIGFSRTRPRNLTVPLMLLAPRKRAAAPVE